MADFFFDPSRPWRRRPTLSVLVGMSDLRDALHLNSPSVVANWRSRFANFPAAKVSNPPLFELVEVLDWLLEKPGTSGRSRYGVSVRRWYRLVVRSFLGQAGPGSESVGTSSARNTAVAVVLLHHLVWDRNTGGLRSDWDAAMSAIDDTDAAALVDKLVSLAEQVEAVQPSLRGDLVPYLRTDAVPAPFVADLVDALDLVARFGVEVGSSTSTWNADTRLGVVLVGDRDTRARQATATAHAISELMATLARPSAGHSMLDPAVGEASVLVECAKLAPGVALYGQELEPPVRSIARAVLEVRDLTADLGAYAVDTLRTDLHASLRADAVVIDPPYGGHDHPEAWLDYAQRHTSPDGHVVMLLSASVVVSVSAARRRPQATIQDRLRQLAGQIDMVVVLPRNLRPDVVGPLLVVHLTPHTTPAMSEIQVVTVVTEHRIEAEDAIRRLAERLWSAEVGHNESGLFGVLSGLPDVEVATVDADRLFVELERSVQRVEELSARRGAPRRSRIEWDPPQSTDDRLNVVRRAIAPRAAPSSASPLLLELSEIGDLDAARLARLEASHAALAMSVRALLRTLEKSQDLISEKLQSTLRPDIERIERNLDI